MHMLRSSLARLAACAGLALLITAAPARADLAIGDTIGAMPCR